MKKDVYVLLHNIRSLYNVGSIFRTADGAGVKKIFITGYTGTPPRKEISKTALGAEEAVEWEHWNDPVECINNLKKEGVKIIALEITKKSIDYRKFRPKGNICLILGHEVDGVSDSLLEMADEHISIPMRGIKESLNVSVAFGVVAYQFSGSK